ncbi:MULTISPECIES: 7-carboxy-7-deazaguanine synthase QueE [Rhodanobacter]|uniref:7-carboxy-7-deazaguanine synthase QueE n=1 Tax=Rhodanobacter TaxID=75309 RepID=UPI000260D4E5|nr:MULTISPECIES: 7-carboxy-7-deazaguanine synthase QueE [Rhodanobacter]EIM04857.1 organic radical activating enzyme [Rhodanobacter denitrificans]KZC19918.1 7-carboxy-7-deazaguanine synthase [Rhodanobacter denitrificans]UJJ51792.1 7-carboxy-7-deazaguanine synthase QueE [Rhodanobacter denitrificans]UJJ59433.1 7-carboxy-7-deazaguanine synthase QueE [Rhodanobacter denitrificans]UJM89897.1 7-carboxy-7-deazaguanine synthase QueE [Rhodanobacter denitrificans]
MSGDDARKASGTPAAAVAERLRITEIFHSIQGEADAIGWRTVFVRLTGCPLRCVWCDTEYSFYGGNWHAIDDILAEVATHGAKHVCVTGGEPLAQKRCLILLRRLCDAGYEVSLETSGALDVSAVDPRVRKVMDLKAPGSGESARNLWSNLDHLLPHDQIKIVLASRADYEWARAVLAEHALADRCMVLFSSVWGKVEPRELAEWIIADKLPVRFQLQLHKLLWSDARGK